MRMKRKEHKNNVERSYAERESVFCILPPFIIDMNQTMHFAAVKNYQYALYLCV